MKSIKNSVFSFKLEKGGAQSQNKAKLFQVSIFFHELIPSLSIFVNTKVGNRKTQPTKVFLTFETDATKVGSFFSISNFLIKKTAQVRNRFLIYLK